MIVKITIIMNNTNNLQKSEKYVLKKTLLKNKKTKYEVISPEGEIVSSRTSSRDNYIACTIDGHFYFGRLDLIGKADHGQRLDYAKVHNPDLYKKLVTIAYLEDEN